MAVTQRVRTLKNKKVSTYEAEVYVRGDRVTSKSFPTKAAAYSWEAATKKRLQAGEDDPGSMWNFEAVVDAYRTSDFLDLRRSSQQSRASRFRYLLEAPCAKLLMKDFDAKTVDDWLRWLRLHPTVQDKQRQSFHQELKLISVILNWYKNEKDPKFTIPIVKRHRKAAHFKPVPVRPQDYYMRPDEVVRWLEQLKQRPDPVYRRLAILMLLTGLRMGEAAGLCWDAVNLESKDGARIRVIRTLSWDYTNKEPYFQNEAKTDSSVRTVPIEGAVLDMLLKMKALKTSSIGQQPIFLNSKGNFLRDNTIRDNFNAAFKACDLAWSGSHIARHTFATLALMSVRDIGTVQAALGHASQKETAGYAKVVALQSSKVTENVAQMIGMGRTVLQDRTPSQAGSRSR